MRAHDASASGDTFIEHFLHDFALMGTFRKANAVALPVGSGPVRFEGQDQSWNFSRASRGNAPAICRRCEIASGRRFSCSRPMAAWMSVRR